MLVGGRWGGGFCLSPSPLPTGDICGLTSRVQRAGKGKRNGQRHFGSEVEQGMNGVAVAVWKADGEGFGALSFCLLPVSAGDWFFKKGTKRKGKGPAPNRRRVTVLVF